MLPFALNASTILSYNIYDRTDRVDVMITFDTPYTGLIKQSASTQNIIIKLEDAQIESAKTKKLASNFLNALSITPMAGHTQIVASVPPSVTLQASKTSDSYGLRLRFSNAANKTQSAAQAQQEDLTNPFSSLPTKQDADMTQSYSIVIAFLVIGIIILFYIKRKVSTQQENKTASWLFTSNAKQKTKAKASQEVRIRFQKSIDDQNSVVMLDFGQQSYLVLMGKSNILLDTFTDDKPLSQNDFENILQTRHQELDAFLQGEIPAKPQEAFQSYKEKASSISYDL